MACSAKANLSLDLSTATLTIPLHDRTGQLTRDLGEGYVCSVNETQRIRPETHTRVSQVNVADGRQTTFIDDDFGEFTFTDHKLTVGRCAMKNTQYCPKTHILLLAFVNGTRNKPGRAGK